MLCRRNKQKRREKINTLNLIYEQVFRQIEQPMLKSTAPLTDNCPAGNIRCWQSILYIYI